MFERFTDRTRRAVVLAMEEARVLGHDHIGTEHLLLGVASEEQGVAAKALGSMGISLTMLRVAVEQAVGRGSGNPTGHIPFTPRAKKVLELSLREATRLGHDHIGTEHILLGLIREGDGVAAQILEKLGADQDRVRERIAAIVAGDVEASDSTRSSPRAVRVLGDPPQRADARDAEQRMLEVRALKEWAIDHQDFELAAVLRDAERLLRSYAASGERSAEERADQIEREEPESGASYREE